MYIRMNIILIESNKPPEWYGSFQFTNSFKKKQPTKAKVAKFFLTRENVR